MNTCTAAIALALVTALTGPVAAASMSQTVSEHAFALFPLMDKMCPDQEDKKNPDWCGDFSSFLYHMARLPNNTDPDSDIEGYSMAVEIVWSLQKCPSHVAWDYRCRPRIQAVKVQYVFDTLEYLELPYRKSAGKPK